MSGIGGTEFILLCLIGLMILGPERLPKVARKLGGWVGKARQMTRTLKRQLEEEVDAEKILGFDPSDIKNLTPEQLITPRDDDTFSPMHVEEDNTTPAAPSSEKTEKNT